MMLQRNVARLGCMATLAVGMLPAIAQAADPRFLGSSRADVPSARHAEAPVARTANSLPTVIYTNAQYATAGIALRNRGVGVMNISGAVPPFQAGYLYFANLYTGTAPTTLSIRLAYLTPGKYSPGQILTLNLVATGVDPCWGSSGIAVYRLKLPSTLLQGNGSYQVTLAPADGALTTGEDPWDGNVQYPLAEGASLVLIGTGAATVGIYDKTIPSATTLFATTYSYTLKLPAPAPGNQTLFDSIGADGQLGVARAAYYDNLTTINGTVLSGSGGLDPTSDFGGTSGLPLPQLWDDTGHDITGLIASGATTLPVSLTSNVGSEGSADCISTIANVVSVQ